MVENSYYRHSLIRLGILVTVENAYLIFISNYQHMPSIKVTDNMLNVTIPVQIRISGSKLIPQSFVSFGFEY